MSEPAVVPPTEARPAPSQGRRGTSWGEIAEICGGIGMILFLAWAFCYKLSHEERVVIGVALGPLIVLTLLVVLLDLLSCARYPGDYPPLGPSRPGSSWLVRPPGVPFWTAFPTALCALYYVGLGIIIATHDLGLRWGLWGVSALAVVGFGAAVALGLKLRSRPELEVDEERREVLWRPNAVWASPVTLPFDAVVDVRVARTGRRDKLICYLTIAWRSDTGRVRKTRLPISGNLEHVQELVARLQVAVFGTTSPSTS